MKYSFLNNQKYHNQYPFDVLFECDDCEGVITVYKHDTGSLPVILANEYSGVIGDIMELTFQLDDYLNGEWSR